jgi:hypothetical protein
MTPEEEGAYALDFPGQLRREDLSPAGQAAYDRIKAERDGARPGWDKPSVEPLPPGRTSPEIRERILSLVKKANPKYAKPFRDDANRMAWGSIIGTESWADYGQVVIQMAILDTLLSIEEKLSAMAPGDTRQED